MNTKPNYNASEFVNEVEKFSKHPLNRKAEMIAIYEASVDANQLDVYRELCFTAKYLVGMIRVIKDGGTNPQVNSLDQVKKDFSENMTKAIDQIRQIISGSKEEQKKYFEEEFFEKTHSALTNLNELLADLESAKLYLNYLKREKKT
jgi:hypothetical protein